MGTINEKINYLEETKNLIKNALLEKGIDVSDDDTFRSYVQKIIDYNGGFTSITDASYLFYKKARLDNMDSFMKLLNKVTSTAYMFYECNLEDVPQLDTSECTDMSYMFYQNPFIDFSQFNFDTSKVTNMEHMFEYAGWQNNNESNPTINTSNVTRMTYMFANTNFKKITGLDTSNVQYFNQTFSNLYDCMEIQELDMSSAININYMFYSSFGKNSTLTTVGGLRNLGKAYTRQSTNFPDYQLRFHTFTAISHDSLMNIVNTIYDLNLNENLSVDGVCNYTQNILLSSNNVDKLTDEEIAIATNKGWSVSYCLY